MTLRAALIAGCAGLASLLGPAAAHAAPPPPAVSLDAGWSFTPAGGAARPVTVPHVFDPVPRTAEFHGTTGRYRLRFTAPPAAPGYGWGIHFGQARRVARVVLNGRLLGVHRDPYVPFTLPASGLRAGQVNQLDVDVDNRKGAEPREGWWNWGGLTEPVSLVPRGAVELQDPGTMSEVSCAPGGGACSARLLVDGTLVNRSGVPQPAARVTAQLTPPGGGRAIRGSGTSRPLAPGESGRIRFTVRVPAPQLWSPGAPNLYAARLTTATSDGQVTQVDQRRVGLREVRVRNGMLELNGHQLDLRGAAIQQDVDGHGAALTDADEDAIVAQLKALHVNVTRAHYLLDERLLDKLDAAGIMVWSQAPIYHRDALLRTPAERAAALSTLRGTVLGARSHPSVITHSVANELTVTPDTTPGTRDYLSAARAEVADLDPTLPPSVDLLSYPGYGRQDAYAAFPLLGINSYFGWYKGKPGHSTANIDALAPFLDHMRVIYPRQAMLLTEFGAESTVDGPAWQKQTYAFQSDYVRKVLKIVEDRPFLGGAIYWTLREFAVKPNWDGGAGRVDNPIHHKGLITYDGRRKPAWDVAEQEFAATPLYRVVSGPDARDMPAGRGGGSVLLVWGVALLLVTLLTLDAWALTTILHRSGGAGPDKERTRPALQKGWEPQRTPSNH